MAVAQRYEIAPCSFDPTVAAGSDFDFAQLTGWRLNANTRKHRIRVGGNVTTLGNLVVGANPTVNLRTADLTTVLANVPLNTGVCIENGSTLRLMQHEDCDAWATGTSHLTVTSTHGMLFVESIDVDDSGDEPAQANVTHIGLSDPATDGALPYTVTDSVDFAAAPAAAFTSAYFLGGVYHNSTEIPGVVSVNINTGLQVSTKPVRPGPFPTLAYISDFNPEVSIRLEKVNEIAGFTSLFGHAVNTEFAIYLQKAVLSDDRVAKATAQHIKISFTAGTIDVADIGGDAASDADVNMMIKPVGAFTINTASAIP